MAFSPYFDYVPYRNGSKSQEITDLINVMEQNDFKISHLRSWLQSTELPQNDVTHEQLDRAFKDTERMEKILDEVMNGKPRLTREVLLYKELLHHKDWQLSQLVELDLEIMRLSCGHFSGPVMAVSSAIAGSMNDVDSLPSVSSPVDSGTEPPTSSNHLAPTLSPAASLGAVPEKIIAVGTDPIPTLYDPEHAPYPMLEEISDISPDPIPNLDERIPDDMRGHIPGNTQETDPMSMQDYIREFVPGASPNPILNYGPGYILEDIPDHSLDPLIEFIRGDISDTAPDHVRDSTPDNTLGDVLVPFSDLPQGSFLDHDLGCIPKDALGAPPEPLPTTASLYQHPIPEYSSFASTNAPIQSSEDVFMPDSTSALENTLEPSAKPDPIPEPTPTPGSTISAVPVLVLVPVRNNNRVGKRSGKYRLVKHGGGHAYKLQRRRRNVSY